MLIAARHLTQAKCRLATPQPVDRQVDGDPEDPRSKPPRTVELIEMLVHLEKRLLRQVARLLLVVHQATQQPLQPLLVPDDEDTERLTVSTPNIFDEARIGDDITRIRFLQ